MTEPREVGLREARAVLGDLARAAADRSQITYLTSHGFRVAAVVSVADAEDIERLRRRQS
jgi:prevent-host-death family protein